MSNLVIGYGVQGQKRVLNIDSSEKIYIYDPYLKDRNLISNLENFNFNLIQNVYICTPDNLKEFYINKFLKLKKNILIEKPLILRQSVLENIKKRNKAKFYKHNHRFEPHIVKIKELLDQNLVGKVYHINIHYGSTIKLGKTLGL